MIKGFIHEYYSWYLLYISTFALLALTFYLQHLNFNHFLTAILISGTLLLLVTLYLFFRFARKMAELETLDLLDLPNTLSQPSDLAYLAVLERQNQAYKAELHAYKNREEELQALIKIWSHQMKVPLSALSLMSQTGQISKSDLDSQLLSLEHYLANLLNYLKLTNQASDFRFEQLEVKDLIVALIKQYRIHFLQKDLKVDISGHWQLKTDRKWLSFALAQILDNAVKYSRTGGTIRIQLADGIKITDQGIGILPEDLPRLFSQGFTGYNGHEHQKATGFGLYMTHQILNQISLAITIDSQVELGTTVRITKK